jgi:hypothetical protein
LLTEGEVFENEILSRTESTDNPAQEMPKEHSHGKNLIGTSQIELLVKLLILRVFEDTPTGRPTAIYPVAGAKILSFPRLGGLHHRYAVAA